MSSHDKVITKDSRSSNRIKENSSVSWHVKDRDTKGQGKIRNISTTGMLLETNSNFQPFDNCFFSFDSVPNQDNFIPQHGRLVWFKKKDFAADNYMCGVQFVEPAEDVLSKLRDRVQRGVLKFAHTRKWTTAARVLIYGVIIALVGFSLWLSLQIYSGLTSSNGMMFTTSGQQANLFQDTKQKLIAVTEQLQTTTAQLITTTAQLATTTDQLAATTAQLEATKALYEESQTELQNVNKELVATKAILAETETMLNQAKESNNQLTDEMQTVKIANEQQLTQLRTDLENKKVELETTIAQLQVQNTQLTAELETTQKQLRYYEGEFNGREEGKALLTLYRSKIKLVKTKINYIKQEAENARISAQKEQDKIRMVLGNNGYIVKNGVPVKVDILKYNAPPITPLAEPESAEPKSAQPESTPDRKISVDVKIVE